jgi:N-acetylmuramoyl-L-alanine amidase
MDGHFAMNLKVDYLPGPSKARPMKKLKGIESITIHWIGPYPNQSVYSPYYWWRDGTDGSGVEASAHYIIKDLDVLQAIPIDEVAWHCGSSGNYTSIGIEVVPMSENGLFSNKSIVTLKQLLSTLPKVPLKRHYDWTKKDCPRYYISNDKWNGLLSEVI